MKMVELFIYADIQASRPLGLYRPEKIPKWTITTTGNLVNTVVLVNPRNKVLEKLPAHREYLNNSL
jgi:hypothetical protein